LSEAHGRHERPAPGTLYLVATPIGNLEDVTRRALRVLGEADRVAAEDTRRTRRLLDHYGIATRVERLDDRTERERAPRIVERLQAGERIALVTDAGSPGISDPGYPTVRSAIAAGVRVESVPGPSAVITALQVSGLPTDAFTFAGFLPPKGASRRRRLEELFGRRETIVVFESPHRIESCLADLAEVWGERPIALARELTKIHEQVLRGTASEVRSALRPDQHRGEIVLVLGGLTRRSKEEES
jgi:16S rRNA (cytidine1402-2'-O)-methyltransferase